MPARIPIRASVAALACALALATCTSSGGSGGPTPGPTATASPGGASGSTATTGPGAAPLDLRITSATAAATGSHVSRGQLRTAVHGVRETLTSLYTIGFLDPASWHEGAYTPLFRWFERDLRAQAHRNLRQLSLGPLWRSTDSVRPTKATVDVRFVADTAGRPVVAVVDADLAATARSGDARGDIGQTGRFVLRKDEGTWRVAGYQVKARIPSSLDEPAQSVTAEFLPGVPQTHPMTLLVIGSDARPNQSLANTRGDSLHLVGIDPESGRLSVLGIPRDSWVPIPGHGTDKINASLADGGPELVVQTVEHLTGVHIDAYVLTGFAGFVKGVGAIGGIDVTIPYAISDHYAHAQFRPGPEHLGGKQALSFARARHALPHGDFDRSLNQGRLLLGALATLRSEVRSGSAPFLRWAAAGAEYLRTDLSLEDLFELLVAAPAFDPRTARNRVATGRVGSIAGKSVVLLDARAHAMFRDFARDDVLGG